MRHRIVIDAGKKDRNYYTDLWRYRELFLFLSWRDILVRYKQTFIGIAWAVVRPFLTMVIFTVVFSRIARLPSGSAPYPLMVFAALLPWQFFANSLTESSNSLLINAGMISKVYFPRLALPFSAIAVSFIDFLISFGMLAALMVWYGFAPSWRILCLPVFVVLAIFAALGPGFLIAALNAQYRDFRYIVPFIVQLGLFVSPVGFSAKVIPARWQLLYSLNPMVGVIEGFRWAVLGGPLQVYPPGFVLSVILVFVLFAAGLVYFRKMETVFADVI